MKKMKKLLSMLLTVIMVLAMAAPSFAAEVAKTTIKVEGGKVGAQYVAVKLLNSEEIPGEELGADSSYKYSVNENYRTVLQTITGKTNDGEIISYIAGLTAAAATREFADNVYKAVKDNLPTDKATAVAEGDKVVATFENVDQGYYLIIETATALEDDAISLVMLNTAGQETCTITTKEDVPTVDKKVVENDGDKVAGDYAIGDTIEYKLTGTLPNNLANYDSYFYQFTDNLSDKLDLMEETVKVTVGSTDITEHFTKQASEHSLVLTCGNVKPFVSATDTIVVTYSAKVNQNAQAGAMGNTVKVEFSKDPYDTTQHGTTTETKVNVYTFTVSVDKVDVNNAPLKGAGFTLSKLDDNGSFVPVGDEIKGEDVTTFNFVGLSEGRYKLEETTVPTGFNRAEDIYFTISATYKMKDNEKESVIESFSVTVTNSAGEALTGEDAPQLEATMDTCTITTSVVNNTGTMLPSTGGIGTTIFYAAGIILMAGAVFFVVRRKRA